MRGYFLKRLLLGLPVILGVLTATFFLIHAVPGDPVALLLGEAAEESDRVALRERLGLDQPILRQYLNFLARVPRGDWGTSISHDLPVLDLLRERFPSTAFLAIAALFVACSIAVPLGLFAASRRGQWADRAAMVLALLGHSVPLFVLAPLVVRAFAIELPYFPVSGGGTWRHAVLPTLCLGFGISGLLCRMLRSSAVGVLGSNFIRAARARGIAPFPLYFRHVLRVSLLPLLTVLGGVFGGLLAGAVVTETLFDWPGLGRLFYTAFQARDYPLVQGIVLWISLIYVGVQILLDFAYAWADPRIRLGEGEVQ